MMETRIDKYLFAMRIYKTRSIAADACKNGRVKLNGLEVKPSRMFHVGDVFTVRKGAITYTYRILQLCEHRLGAKLVPDYLRDETPPEQRELLELARLAGNGGRDRGTGRPTKKDQREIESFISSDYNYLLDSIDDDDDE
ncbi:MAG: RNA-binding S4 domain-containing protein [Paludibacteraceae bacterium]|nr:RNA-binding S4 domain-containing protein [Paludibacteraceae bacterium]